MRDPEPPRWVRALAALLRSDHRRDIVDDLLEEQRARAARGDGSIRSACWLVFHLIWSAAAGWMARLRPVLSEAEPIGVRIFRGVSRDVRYAGRRLAARAGLSLVAILTLTIGIGLTAGVFGVVNAVLFKAPPIPEIDRVVTIPQTGRAASAPLDMDFASYEALAAARPDVVSSLSASSSWFGAVTGPERAELLSGEMVSADYFRTLALTPQAGTFFLSENDRLPRKVVVISDHLWHLWFDGSPNVVGQRLVVSGDPLTIVGVAPRGFNGLFVPTVRPTDVWMPFGVTPEIDGLRMHTTNGSPQLGMTSDGVRVMARLREHVSAAVASQAFAALGLQINPNAFSGSSVLTTSPLRKSLMPPDSDAFVAEVGAGLSGLAALVLLIACSNLANLFLADVLGRRGEFAVRLASGATRVHLVRSILTETALLAGLGLVAGLMFASVLTRWIATVSTSAVSVYGATIRIDPSPDWRVVTFGTLVATLVALGIGGGPAWHASRSSPASLLRSNLDGTSPGGRRGTWLVVAQVAACTVLLIVAGLFVRSATRIMSHNPGFDASHTAAVRVDLGITGLSETRGRQFLDGALAAMRELPLVRRAFLATNFPLGFAGQRLALLSDRGSPGDRPQTVGQLARVSEGFFEAMRIPIVEGRSLLGSDRAGSPCVIVINERTAAALWPDERAVGHRLAPGQESAGWCEVVGVTRDTDVNALGRSGPLVFRSFDQAYHGLVSIAVETDADPAELSGPMRAIVRRLDPDVVITDVDTLADNQARVTLPVRAAALSLAALGVIGLAIAMLGLYAVAAHAVKLRTQEIGVRLALGARPGAVKAMVFRQSAAMISGGVVPGLVLAYISAGWLQSTLFGIGSHDPITFVGVPVTLCVVGILATIAPANRAASVDPAVALREL